MSFHPYLFFGGTCRDAFTRYHEVFGGELVLLQFDQMAPNEAIDAERASWIAHAALKLGGELLMGSDDPFADGVGPVHGMMVNVALPDADEVRRVFAALAEGGSIDMPVAATEWSPAFGMCHDRFGMPWMISAG